MQEEEMEEEDYQAKADMEYDRQRDDKAIAEYEKGLEGENKMQKEKLMELKSAMEEEERINEEITVKQAEFEEQNKELFLNRATTRQTISDCKDVLRPVVEEGFKVDGVKKRLGGIGIRVGEILDYDDTKALEWAKEKDMCLLLDKKSFDKIAKVQELDFVQKEERITVTFPKEIKLEDG